MSRHDLVFARLEGVERYSLKLAARAVDVLVALPRGYAGSPRRRYRLVVMLDAADLFGSAAEMSRTLAMSRETEACLLVSADGIAATDVDLLAGLVADCRDRYRIVADEVALFGHAGVARELLQSFRKGIAGVSRCIVATTGVFPEALASPPLT
ncbi:MAG: hypothetical protein M3O62_19920, partial [Pseudomonadota bacterium]|nr:hypothetical protein [Pseudomonadota bacterium]